VIALSPHLQPILGALRGRADLAFRDADIERRFQEEDFRRWLVFTRVSFLLGFSFHAVSTAVISQVAPPALSHVLSLRLFVVTPLLVLIVATTFAPFYERIERSC